MVLQFVRQQQGGNGFGQPGNVLGDIDQCHRQIPRCTQNGKPQCTDQHDIAGGGIAALPQDDRPGQQCDGQYHGDTGMDDAQLFEVAKAAPARRQFPVDGSVKPVVLEAEATECAHQRHVVDDIDHLAIDRRGLVGEVVVQGPAGSRQMEHRHDHRTGDHDQARRHRQAHRCDQGDRRNRCHAWRQHVPDEHVFDREHRIRGRGDAAGQHARQAVAKNSLARVR